MSNIRLYEPPRSSGAASARLDRLEAHLAMHTEQLDHILRHKAAGSGASSGGVITALDLSEWARGRFTATYGASGRTATFAVTHENGLPVRIDCPSAGTITIRW